MFVAPGYKVLVLLNAFGSNFIFQATFKCLMYFLGLQ